MSTRNLEYYMNSVTRVNLAAEISRLAEIYGDNFKRAEIEGEFAFSQVILATSRLDSGLSTEDILPSAVETARSLHELESAKQKLRENGVPNFIVLEITRRVLDRDIANSREIVYKEE
jgi:hypothetical protein